MTIIDKIKESVEGATALGFLYHAAGEMNKLIARTERLPVAFAFLLDSGTIEDVNGRYHERVTLAVMFTDKTQFDFNALENEEIIDRMKLKAYKWLESLRNSNDLQIVSVNSTQRLYDTTTDVLTGYAINITLQDMYGVGECELPEVVIDVDKNGSYNVVGVDKVRVNVVPRLEELEVTQNGEYLPPTDIAGFSKVNVNVQPTLEELTITENGTYKPQEGIDGFSKVTAEFDTSSLPKVKVSTLKVTNDCINEDGVWEGEQLIDTSEVTSFANLFNSVNRLITLNAKKWNTSQVTSLQLMFYMCRSLQKLEVDDWNLTRVNDIASCLYGCSALQEINVTNWNVENVTNFYSTFQECSSLETLDLRNWNLSNAVYVNNMFYYCSGLKSIIDNISIDEVIQNNVSCLKGLKISTPNTFTYTNFDRASLRALINGLADLTGETVQTLTLGATLMAKLTEEDIAIAVNKNWTLT